ncbi:RidA family protein [Streptomyces sp. NPDC085524]|uniref:RidA family protein n=1 Tax=unclassified Streptomyces TaxID=2593676 RepID=UPI0035DE9F32
MAHAIVNPDGLHDPVPFGYSHTATVPAGSELVLIAGQYGSDPDGRVVSADFSEQVAQTFRNVAVALAAHGLGLGHVVQLRTYVVDHDLGKLGPIAAAVQEVWGKEPPTQTLIGVASLAAPDVLFEVEALAVRP